VNNKRKFHNTIVLVPKWGYVLALHAILATKNFTHFPTFIDRSGCVGDDVKLACFGSAAGRYGNFCGFIIQILGKWG
jgi:hypothetical protein